jgi:hypothetical protein
VALLLGADAALVPLRASGTPASRGTIPAKLYQAMALRKPIILIADRDSEAAALLQGYEHIFAAGDDPDEIAAALHRFAAAPRPSRQPEPPAELAGWSRASATRALVDLIEKLNPAFATAGSFAGARIANAPPAPLQPVESVESRTTSQEIGGSNGEAAGRHHQH